jgi:exosortase
VPLAVSLLLLAGLYRDILPEMARQWYQDENYSHGFLVPLVSAWFLYRSRWELLEAEIEPWLPGFVVFLLGLLQLVAGWLGTELFTMRSSVIITLSGIVLFFFGKRLFHLTLLPLGYLLFMVPLPYLLYDAVAFPLRLFMTRVSVALMNLNGVVVLREGNVIMLPQTTLEVADACSGIRSIISLVAVSTAFAFTLSLSPAARAVLILSAVPIAVVANIVRIVGTGLLAQNWGAEAAEGFFHVFAGLAVFILAVALLMAVGLFLTARRRRHDR